MSRGADGPLSKLQPLRDQTLNQLYDLYKTDKWKVRRAAAMTVLKMSTVKNIDEFIERIAAAAHIDTVGVDFDAARMCRIQSVGNLNGDREGAAQIEGPPVN